MGQENVQGYSRNWPEFNEQLVVRGMFYLDFDLFKGWDKEPERMNKNKRGGQYLFPSSFIEWEAVWHQLADYRGLEGITRKLAEAGPIPHYNDYTTIWHRVQGFKPKIILPEYVNLQVKSDGTGLKINNRGEYRMDKYGDKNKRKKHITNFGGDGAFDTHAMFGFLDKHGIRSSIKIRKKAVTYDYAGLPFFSRRRQREVRRYQELGYEKWAEKVTMRQVARN